MPFAEAGIRQEPPVSSHSATGAILPPTAFPDPPLLPVGGSYIFRKVCGFSQLHEQAVGMSRLNVGASQQPKTTYLQGGLQAGIATQGDAPIMPITSFHLAFAHAIHPLGNS